ncbi:hypothetical protein EB796_011123 [Bugula neritina]|uniref:Fibronectin type-III domain-containing protein n=1 Tax=Bugula neritina TaxID=10212 RepID=A0A7J7JZ02_BUGNE|nr:hypothetical protein EB796_011123 [Bugula neritina]
MIGCQELFGIREYSLSYSINDQPQSSVIVKDSLSHQLSDAKAESKYSFRVSGVNSAGIGNYSTEVEVITPSKDDIQHSAIQWNLIRILALTLGILLLIVLGVITSLLLIHRRKMKYADDTGYSGFVEGTHGKRMYRYKQPE